MRLGIPGQEALIQPTLQDSNDLRELINHFKPKLIINCLALADLELCEIDPKLAYWTNSDIPKFLADFSCEYNYKLIHFSTDAIFLDSDKDRDEKVELRPNSIYAKSKYSGELEVLKPQFNHLVCRTNFFGVDERRRNVFSFFASNLDFGNEVNGYSDSYFNPVYVEDLVRMTLALIDLNESGLYHVSGDTKLSKADFGIRIAKAMNLNENLIKTTLSSDDSRWKIRTKDLFLDNTKLRKLGICPISLEEGINRAVEVWNDDRRSNEI